MADAISLEDLVALNDEIAALVRAGAPLEQGLALAGKDLPRGLKRLTAELAARMNNGASLSAALADCGQQVPSLYRAIVEAGIRSGRLPAALESWIAVARRLMALRRWVILAMIYPLLLFFLAYGLFVFFVIKVLPTILIASPLRHPPAIVQMFGHLRDSVVWWGPILPTLVCVLAMIWWLRSRNALVMQGGGAARVFGWAPSFRRLLWESRSAGFAEILALLIEHKTPLADAVKIAAETTGDRELIEAAKQLSAQIAAGNTVANSGATSKDRGAPSSGIAPFLRWLIAGSARQPDLATSLRRSAEVYRRRAVRRADWLRLYLPLLLTIGIGGTATLLYGLSLFLPWLNTLYDLGKP